MPPLPHHTQRLVYVLQLYSCCNAYPEQQYCNCITDTLQLYSKTTIPAYSYFSYLKISCSLTSFANELLNDFCLIWLEKFSRIRAKSLLKKYIQSFK